MSVETRIQALLLARIPVQFPSVRVWRTAVVKAKTPRGWVQSLPEGHPDISGVIGPAGRALYIEVKSETGEMEPAQLAWAEWLNALGAVHIVAQPPRGSGENGAIRVLEHVCTVLRGVTE